MAISKDVSTSFGVVLDKAYIRVSSIRIFDKCKMAIIVSVYAIDPAVAGRNIEAIKEESHLADYDIDGEEPYKQAYGFIKGLDCYVGCVDC
ncbi:hypothetical protein [Aeromonas veronii]|uniref:hypothetical protein n=1 Tax=Aeromonas veronii TaxID=654 RepID=UPI002B4840F6|nr:hypothetical protein [Aeromonas veronii]